jgi:hypothetical protein
MAPATKLIRRYIWDAHEHGDRLDGEDEHWLDQAATSYPDVPTDRQLEMLREDFVRISAEAHARSAFHRPLSTLPN